MRSVFALRVSHTRFLPLLDLDRPAPATRLFTTLADGQRKALFQFFCRRRFGGWRPVGRIEWDSLPSGPAGEPTLELNLTPEGAGNLLLRLRERSSGASRSYRISVPWRPRPEARPARKNAGSRRTALGLGLAAGLLAVAALTVFRFTPLWEWLTDGQAAAERRAPIATPRPKRPAIAPKAAEAPAVPGPPATPEPAPRAAESRPRGVKGHEAPPEGESLSYRVQWGDTLWRISERYYGSADLYDSLAGENAIADPDLLVTGTELRLPPRIEEQDRKH